MTTPIQAERDRTIEYTRQREWFDPARNQYAHVSMVGAGGIGSPSALALAKLGITSIDLIDFDVVEAHNLPNQLYELDAAGLMKVEALAAELRRHSPTHVSEYTNRVTSLGLVRLTDEPYPESGDDVAVLRGLTISGLDNMGARRDLWEQEVKGNMAIDCYLDARLGGESIVIYACNPLDPEDQRGYEATLHSDEQGREASCTRQSIIDVGFQVASLLTRAARLHFSGEALPKITYMNQANLNALTQEAWS